MGTRQELGIFLLVVLLAAPPAAGWLCAGGAAAPPVISLPLQQIRPLTGADCLLLGWRIPLNQATATDLQLVPGIGEVLAGRIVAVRGEQGGFRTLSDLGAVKGIGPGKLKVVRLYLFVDPVKNPGPAP